ncbi:uncharacterized protein LOC125470897 [Pyrus x bretschneideri]|uniref:uncharacterized protein LOC125470897 n=1 Tax=Pyrus x bretschneideri TaxID=225117 RepID=UPI002030F7C7|nr:uncharacterized protein LOC125470897 [Pyrus x bretschneideri]
MYNLKLDKFEVHEGFKGAERWLDHIEKTFRVLHNQGNLPVEKWVETTSWFLGRESSSWWEQEVRRLTQEEKADWEVFKHLFRKRFVPPEYSNRKKQEFIELRQGKLTANEYYQRFTDLSNDSLYDGYSSYKTAKELWESLDKKYKSEVASSKKFAIGKFLNYKMSDTKYVVKQVEELQVIVHEKTLRIHRKNEKYDVSSLEAKANVVERVDSHKARHHQKNKGKDAATKVMTVVKGKTFKKIKGGCWVCGKTGHRAKDCRHKKNQNSGSSNQANVAEDTFVVVISEVNLLTNSND